jgi:hypothetical protein
VLLAGVLLLKASALWEKILLNSSHTARPLARALLSRRPRSLFWTGVEYFFSFYGQ